MSPEPPASASASIEDTLHLLRTGELRPLGLMPNASNYTFLAEVHGGGRTALAVYKPRDGEAPLWDFPEGTLCHREVAAFVLARALGWPGVPPTVLRDGPNGEGSVQLFVDTDPREHFFTLRETRLDDFQPIAAFDVVANNADRKGGHCLLGSEGSIWVIDHGVCFAVEPKLRTVIWDFAGEPLPPGLASDLARVCGEVRAGPLRDELERFLTGREVEAIGRRIERFVASGRFPEPGSRRAWPWPPV